ncbi:MMPL family transporter [Streptomyces aquilus]|uniref:MMPL family transporter n=1 Tax=Streptomyces aquilus TaxID=2548456 RepID=A0A3Q9C5I0_9ACTN|nr:MMPL family transporter [Streptomyces aquilus]AZP22559.1 MMPL family transporter [Streptomyces aquilus]
MATLLYRLGRLAFRRRRIVLAVWALVSAAVVAGLGVVGEDTDDTFTIPGSESQQALDTLGRVYPAAGGTSAQIVFTAPEGEKATARKFQAGIAATLKEAADAPQVTAVLSPEQTRAVSKDGRSALAQVQYSVSNAELADGSLDALEDTIAPAEKAGLTVSVGGQAYNSTGVDISAKEVVGVVIALIILVITFGSLLAAGMPVLTAVVGVVIGAGGLLLVSHLTAISSTALTLTVMLGLAVGIDYTLFILSRHRDQLKAGMATDESAARAIGTSGSAVAFAALTVIIAMVGLSVVGIPFLTAMGLAGAGGVAIAALVALTLLPALLGFAGDRLRPRPKKKPAPGGRTAPQQTLGARWVHTVTRIPALTVVLVTAGLLVVAWPARDLRLALPDNGSAAQGTTQRETYDTISEEFGPGLNGPLLILMNTDDAKASSAAQLTAELNTVRKELAATKGVALASAAQRLDPEYALLTVVPTTGSGDEATKDLVKALRDKESPIRSRTGISLQVTGQTAVNVDVSQKLSDSLLTFAIVVVGLCLLILLIVFRSLVVPVKATVGFLLSVAASFGAVVAVFQWGWAADLIDVARTGPVVSFLPIILMAVLFGLAMDYEVFVVSSIHEEYAHGGDARRAVLTGSPLAFRVVTAAALIMVAVFAGFVTMQDAIVKPIAFALAFGVLVDAFLIRMTFVPAVLMWVGRAGWWLPRGLRKILPNVDIEGRDLPKPPAQPSGTPATASERD